MSNDPQQDADAAVKPQVIDLDAVDVTPDEVAPPDAETPPSEPPPRKPKESSRTWLWAALLVALGAVAGGWLYRDMLSAWFPSNEMQAMSARIGALEVSNKALTEQAGAASAAADGATRKVADLDTAVKGAAGAANAAGQTTAALDARIATLEQSAQSLSDDLAKLRSGLTASTAGAGNADPAALAAIGQRLDALEKSVAALKSGAVTPADAAQVSALRQSLADLQAKIAAGAPYRADLDNVLRMVPAAGGNDLIASYADNGLANAQGLAAELRAAAATLPKPQAPANDGGYVSSFWNAVTSVVTIHDVGDTDWPVLAETAAKLADENKLAEAVAALDAAQGAMPDGLAKWRDRAIARTRLETAVAELAQAVGLTLAARGGGQ